MTPVMLQEALMRESKKILKDMDFKTPLGKRVPMNVYAQNIPIAETDDDVDPVPYLIVRLSSGNDDGTRDSFYNIRVILIVGIWDDDLESQGHRDILSVIDKIFSRFATNPVLEKQYVFTGNFHWATQEDNYYPYYFGACNLDFNIPAVRREDPYA